MRRQPRSNPRPLVPDPEDVYEKFRDFAQRTAAQFYGSYDLFRESVTLDDVKAFLDYIEGALRAIPVEPGEPLGPFRIKLPDVRPSGLARIDYVLGPDDGLTEVQGWLSCEVNYGERSDAGLFGMQWLNREAIDSVLLHGENDPERSNFRYERYVGPDDTGARLMFNMRVRGSADRAGFYSTRPDEPAWILHNHVPKSKWDEMMASGRWAYPVTRTGKLITKRTRNQFTGEMQLDGLWRYIGAPVPTNDPRDFTHWLGSYWQKALGIPKRSHEEREAEAEAEHFARVLKFKVGDRVRWVGEEGAIPADWRGRIVSHEPYIDDGLYFNVRWNDGQHFHEGLYHQSDLAPLNTNPTRMLLVNPGRRR